MRADSIRKLMPLIGIFLLIVTASSLISAETLTDLGDHPGISDTDTSLTISQSGTSLSGISSSKVVSYTPSDGNDASISTSVPPRIQEQPPERWIRDTKTDQYYDPVSRTYWRYDSVIRKFYCKDKEWYLVTRFSDIQPARIVAQYYYDPRSISLIDMETGQSINPSTMEAIQPTQTQTPARTIKPTYTKTPIPQETGETGISGSDSGTLNNDPCLVTCQDCPDGYCRDCNHNQICDEIESGTSGTTSTGGQSENPQGLVQPVPSVTNHQSGQSEAPQPIVQPTQTPVSQGGISETAQAPILAMKMGSTWTNENTDAVMNNPTSPTLITFDSDVQILSISTYHWNNGQGVSAPGTIGVKDSDGTMYGPWQATGEKGTDGVPNTRWTAIPETSGNEKPIFKKGSYTVIDSDQSTWSVNTNSKNQGFCTVEYISAINTSSLSDLSDSSIKPLDLKSTKIGDLTS
ncbi:hypothetical protein [uncultured Methanospirillum sp.]|uniref:hypothetical protein n=1 Tax=uncultured Methanospirillum sp. TaxID=262503 RepID=UPI0029C68E2C|nr:hypothetical protein [uncultured Methanospirillum sp.]